MVKGMVTIGLENGMEVPLLSGTGTQVPIICTPPEDVKELSDDRTGHRPRPPLARAGPALRSAVRSGAGRFDRERRDADDRSRAPLLGEQPPVGRQRLRAHVWWLPPAWRTHGRSARTSPHLHDRPRGVCGRFAAGRARNE